MAGTGRPSPNRAEPAGAGERHRRSLTFLLTGRHAHDGARRVPRDLAETTDQLSTSLFARDRGSGADAEDGPEVQARDDAQ